MSFFGKFKKNRAKKNLSEIAPKMAESGEKPPLSCKQVGEELQSFLDAEHTEVSAEDLAAHLEACKDCGLEADVYRKIKATLSQKAAPLDEATLTRLHEFGRELAQSGEPD